MKSETTVGIRRPAIVLPVMQHPLAGLAVLAVLFVAAPFGLGGYQLTLFETGIAYSVGVVGVAVGFASVGMLMLMQPAMMVIGAFVSLYLIDAWDVSFVLAAGAAVLAGMIVALPLGWLACRLDKFSFAVLSFTFTYLVTVLMSSAMLVGVTGGDLGRPYPPTSVLGVPLAGMPGYVAVAVVGFLAFAGASVLFRSTLGRILVVMREDDLVAHAIGVNASAHKVALTSILAGFGALSGALVGLASGFISPPQFDVALSISLLAMALIGGSGYAFGAFLGTALFLVVPAVAGLAVVDRNLAVGLILLVSLTLSPKGLLSLVAMPRWVGRPGGQERKGASHGA